MQNQSIIKAIVFDWDGVIVDSMPMIARGIQETAKSYGVHLSVDDVLATYMQPRHTFYENLGIKIEDFDELNARHATNILKHFSEPKLFGDVLPALAQLNTKGVRMGVASNDTGPRIPREVKMFGLETFFPEDNIISSRKRKPEKLADMMARFGVKSAELLFVGDLPSDVTAARKVGALSAAISRHESGKARLKALNPDYLLDSLTDLLKIAG
ncbi:MAG: HAD-IA family hydrolase [bacterium]|nr:HAD-IA family hydrolase [bacterium]